MDNDDADDEVMRLSAELRDELSSSERRKIDPRYAPVRYTALKSIDRSPAHYVHTVQTHVETTLSMRLGSGAHAITFGTPEIVTYSKRRAGKEWSAFASSNAGKLILSEREYSIAAEMAAALTGDMVADSLLFGPGARHEQEVCWQIDGRDCRGRLDAYTDNAVIDLKTTKSADPRNLEWQIHRDHWATQVVWYADGLEASGGGWRHPYIVAVENSAPYPVTVYKLSDSLIQQCRAQYTQWFKRLRECETSNIWPGYSSSVLTLEPRGIVPAYTGDE